MSRSGYSDDIEEWALIRWRGQVASAIRGKRGQALLRDMIEALDALPEKCLITHDLENEQGDVCALGAVGRKRALKMADVDPEEPEQVAALFDIAPQLAQEIVYENDEVYYGETPEHRWQRMRKWAAAHLSANGTGAANNTTPEAK